MKPRHEKTRLLSAIAFLLILTLLFPAVEALGQVPETLVTGLSDTQPITLQPIAPTLITGLPDTLPLAAVSKSPESGFREMIAAYVATAYRLDFPKSEAITEAALREELSTLVQKAARQGINTLFFQVRPASDAFYNSSIFPTSRYLVKNEGDTPPLDVLKTLIELAEPYGIGIYAWINPYRVTSSGESLSSLSATNPARLHPDWIFEKDGAYYYQPALREVQTLIAGGVAEIVQNYGVKGILFDDYFYPEGMTDEDSACYEAYQREGGALSLADFRRENVNALIRTCYQTVKAIDENCAFGASPRGIWRNIREDENGSLTAGGAAYDDIYCDALAWVKEKTVDFLAPQLYWSYNEKNAPFLTLLLWWENALRSSDTLLIPSLAAYRLSDAELSAEIFYLSTLDLYHGYALYRMSNLNE